jgi:nicotinamide-nucleotide amidase
MTETLSDALPTEVERLVERVLAAACDRDLRLATAESCTGGLLASVLTDVEGRSHAFERGFVTYTDEAKHEQLGVPKDVLASHGAVSEPVARLMAAGAVDHSRADVAVSVTGFAGSAGADDEPGLVHFAVADRKGNVRHEEHHFGDVGRGPVRLACLKVGLRMLLEAVEG